MKKLVIFHAVSVAVSTALMASDVTGLSEFEKILEEATEIATKTRLNADYVPGTVTVISGERLKSLGVTNLSDPIAFDMIVGFDSPTKSMRGSGAIYGSQGNKIKWMINDKVIDSEIWGSEVQGRGPLVFPLPVDMIERIDIVRGPGSSLYGGNAIYGVVNIVTKKNTNALYATLSRNESNKFGKEIGAYQNYESADYKINLYASINKNDGWDLPIGSSGNFYNSVDAYYTPGYGPGNLPSNTASTTIMMDIKKNNWNVWLYRLEMNNGYAYTNWNPAWALPQEKDSLKQGDTNLVSGIQNEFYINDIKMLTKIGYNKYNSKVSNYFAWPASSLQSNSITNPTDGMFDQSYGQQKIFSDVELYKKFQQHKLTSGVSLSKTWVDTDSIIQNYEGLSYLNPVMLAGAGLTKTSDITAIVSAYKAYLKSTGYTQVYTPGSVSSLLSVVKPTRIQKAFYMQDEYEFSDKMTITAGLRYDTYSDSDGALSPRLALVYRYDDSNIFKAQYSRAFRSASFIEKYSSSGTADNVEITPELVDTLELSYIYKKDGNIFRGTGFYSLINKMITFHDNTYQTMNLPKNSYLSGVEVEAKKEFDSHELSLNFGVYDSRREDFQNQYGYGYGFSEFGLASRFIANVIAVANKDTNYPTTFWYHYTGAKHRVNNAFLTPQNTPVPNWITGILYTTNSSTPAQDYLNITQQFKGLSKGLDLSIGVKNAFGKTLKTLYMPLNPPNNQDVPYMRQTFWANLLYRF